MAYVSVLNVQDININVDKYLPFSGVYFFTFSMMKHEDVEEVYVYLMHNGNTVFSMYRWVVISITVSSMPPLLAQRLASARESTGNQQSLT